MCGRPGTHGSEARADRHSSGRDLRVYVATLRTVVSLVEQIGLSHACCVDPCHVRSPEADFGWRATATIRWSESPWRVQEVVVSGVQGTEAVDGVEFGDQPNGSGRRPDGATPHAPGQQPHGRGRLRVVRLAPGPREGVVGDGCRRRHGAHRSQRLRQVDVPAHPQPDARAGPVGGDGRPGRAGRHRHLRPEPAAHRGAAPDRHGVPEAQPLPGHDDCRQRHGRAQAHRHPGGSFRASRAHRDLPHQGRAVARGQGPVAAAPAATCPVDSSSGCASRGRWRSNPTSC